MFCQQCPKPADQKHVAGESEINNHSLTHICIISPVLQKCHKNVKKGNDELSKKIRNIKIIRYNK
jgi:hypothetical protein